MLGFGLLWLIATIVVDNLVDTGVIDFILLSDFGFLGLAIAASLKMANDVIRTEEELEGLVGERTAELEESNARLVEEIDERQQARRSLEERINELDTLHSIGKTLATVTDLPAGLQKAEELVTDLFDAAMAYIVVPAAEDNAVKIAVGYDRTHGAVGTTPLDASVGRVVADSSRSEAGRISHRFRHPVAAPGARATRADIGAASGKRSRCSPGRARQYHRLVGGGERSGRP